MAYANKCGPQVCKKNVSYLTYKNKLHEMSNNELKCKNPRQKVKMWDKTWKCESKDENASRNMKAQVKMRVKHEDAS